MPGRRIGGIISVKADGELYLAKGNFTYNLGKPMREGVVGHDAVHGYKELPQIPFIEGEFTDTKDMDLEALVTLVDVTVTIDLANGKIITLRDAWWAADGTWNTEEGNGTARFEGMSADEIR